MTEQQIVAICNLQQFVQESEDALNHSLDAVHRSLSETITSDVLTSSAVDMASFMSRMSVAMSKLSSLEAFVRQVTVKFFFSLVETGNSINIYSTHT